MATFSDAAKLAALQGIVDAMESAGVIYDGIVLILNAAGPVFINALFINAFPIPAFQQTGPTQLSLISPKLLTVEIGAGVLTGAHLVGRDNNIWVSMTVGDAGSGAECEITPSNLALVAGQQYLCSSVILEIV